MISGRLSRGALVVVLTLLSMAADATPAFAKGGGNPLQAVGLVLAGPLVLLLWLAAIAVVYLILSSVRRREWLVSLTQTAAVEIGRGRVVFTLWGIVAEILLITAGLVLKNFPALGLLVASIWLLAVALAGLGTLVSAHAAGRRLHAEFDGGEVTALGALGIGLRVFFAASAAPFVGWLVVGLSAAYGAGAVLTACFRVPIESIDRTGDTDLTEIS